MLERTTSEFIIKKSFSCTLVLNPVLSDNIPKSFPALANNPRCYVDSSVVPDGIAALKNDVNDVVVAGPSTDPRYSDFFPMSDDTLEMSYEMSWILPETSSMLPYMSAESVAKVNPSPYATFSSCMLRCPADIWLTDAKPFNIVGPLNMFCSENTLLMQVLATSESYASNTAMLADVAFDTTKLSFAINQSPCSTSKPSTT